ncbi:MAG: bifunctional riboflavin kinase/FAD synthetase [Lachnospiraceae bacterium]|nr:bifunctional riboflavin kinase/FAD synthetase [Lachnospiraceae bacterium]
MEIIADTSEFYLEKETAVAIGKFDGVHLGHRRLLDEILALKKRGLSACVFTFDPAPSVFFGGDPHVLNTNEEKHVIFERMGVDILVEFPMNSETAATSPERFVTEYLVNQMNTRFIAAGTDISFGDKGLGNAELLKKMSAEYNYEVKLIDKVHTADGEEISSSLVRSCVEKGEMERVEELLGAAYSVSGKIVHGNQIGRTIGFPTINIYPNENKLLPPYGVYTSKTVIKGKELYSVSNVGCKPTIGGETRPSVETYIYDFDGDVYDSEATVYLEKFCRPERKFSGLDELKAQLQKDIEESRR